MKDYFSELPDEMIHYLSDFLPFEEFDKLTATCRRIYDVLRQRKIWRSRSLVMWCNEGNLPVVRYITKIFLHWSDPKYLIFQRPPIKFRTTIHYEIYEFCYGHFPVNFINRSFRESCQYGHLEVVRYLFENFREHIKIPAPTKWDNPLNIAVRGGHLTVASYLLRIFPETSACFLHSIFLSGAASSCSIEIIRYLASIYTFSQSQIVLAFIEACRCGSMEIIYHFLQISFGIGKDDFIEGLVTAFENKHSDAISMMLNGIEDKDVEDIFSQICMEEDLNLVKQFVDIRVIHQKKEKSIKNTLLSGIEYACSAGKLETVQYLENLTDDKGRKRINLGVRSNFALADAFISEKFEVVKFLLGKPGVRCKNGSTLERRFAGFVYRYVKDAMKIYNSNRNYHDRIRPITEFLDAIIYGQDRKMIFSPKVQKQARRMINDYRKDVNLLIT